MTITITYPDDNRRPDILLRNPFGGGRQVILDVAVTGVDGSDRKVEDHPDQPMIKRARQKIAKYRKSAEEHGFSFTPFVVSHDGQILKETAAFKSFWLSMEESSNPRNRLYGNYGRVIFLWLFIKQLVEIFCVKLRKW